jgi:ribose 5-phosphate isomerase A
MKEARMSADDYKRQAAAAAIEQVVALAQRRSHLRIGLGTGSTAAHFVDLLGHEVKRGLACVCVPTSEATRRQAQALAIPLTTLDDEPRLDVTVDGADELDDDLQLIKGGGGALLREKIVAAASERMIVIADHTKRKPVLGAFPLPVEVVRFGVAATKSMIELLAGDAGCRGELRLRLGSDRQPFVSDGGNYIFDCAFGQIDEPDALDEALKQIPGVVENGLFLGYADQAIIAGPGGIEILRADRGEESIEV